MAQRGSYAKGVAKREEILTAALDVIARNGYRRTSVRELADAVGLSQAGLLHYFSSKEELFREILRKRDEVDLASFGIDTSGAHAIDGLMAIVSHNAEVPGLVQLYAQLAVEAVDPAHPAHEFFVRRYQTVRSEFARFLRAEQQAGRIDASLDADRTATLFVAASDGLQTQWLLDPTIDMAAHIAHLWHLVTRTA